MPRLIHIKSNCTFLSQGSTYCLLCFSHNNTKSKWFESSLFCPLVYTPSFLSFQSADAAGADADAPKVSTTTLAVLFSIRDATFPTS